MFVLRLYSISLWALCLPLSAVILAGCVSRATPKNEESTKRRLHQLSAAMMYYSQDYDDCLPPATNTSELKKFLDPYVAKPKSSGEQARLDSIFTAPVSGKDFVFNSSLSGIKLETRPLPDGRSELIHNKVMFYEPTAEWKDKKRYVGMQNGATELIPEYSWASVKKSNGIP